MSNTTFQLSREIASPYIEAGAIEPVEIAAFEQGGKATSRYSMAGSFIGLIAPNIYYATKGKGQKIGFMKSVIQSTFLCVTGGGVGTAFGAWRMTESLKDLNRTPQQLMGRLNLFQALQLHQAQPLEYGLPPIPDPNNVNTYQWPSLKTTGVQEGQPQEQPSRANPWAGKQFPQPPRVMDGVARETQDDPSRDSNGRLFPGFTARAGEDDNGDRKEDADVQERRREKEREQFLGGGRLGMEQPTGTLDSATRENATSWALLRSRAPNSSAISTSSTPPPSDFSASSLPPPSISAPSSSSFNSDPRSYSPYELSEREREQAEFDRLLEKERGGSGPASGAGWAAPVGGQGGKESVW